MKPRWESVEIAYDTGHADGVREENKRLLRALTRYLNTRKASHIDNLRDRLFDWIARHKSTRKEKR